MSQDSEDFDYTQYLEGILDAQQQYTISTINNQRALIGWDDMDSSQDETVDDMMQKSI